MKNLFSILLFFFPAYVSFCQTVEKQPLDSALQNVSRQVGLFPQEKIYLQTDKPYYISGEKIFFRVFLLDAFSHQPTEMSRYVYVELINPKDSVVIRQQIRPENHMHYGALILSENLEQGNYRIRAYTRFMENIGEDYFYNQTVYIADPTDTTKTNPNAFSSDEKWEVNFYPEGGNLIAGQSCATAFKALSSDGQPIEVEGEVFDEQDHLLTEFTTTYDGMGRFYLNTVAGERYHAVVKVQGTEYRVKEVNIDLPEVKTDAFALATVWRQNKLFISVKQPEEMPQQKLYLVIHSRGNVIYADEWDFSKEFISIDEKNFPSGVSHLLLLNEDYYPLSERLVFALNEDWLSPDAKTQKEVYGTRDSVKMDVTVNERIAGNFAVAVTDDKDIKIDTTQNILTAILLTSELRGYIHNPAYYFRKDNRQSELAADLLMLTHGWVRYNIPGAMRGDFQYLKVANEESQSFSGLVKGGLLSKPYKGSKVMIFSTNSSFFDTSETDETGHFTINNFEFPDSTKYFIQALNKRGSDIVELYMDSIKYPKVFPTKQYLTKQKEERILESEDFDDYVVKADRKYTMENGMRLINLPEVTIRGKRIYEDENHIRYSQLSHVITAEEIVNGGSDMISLIQRLGIRVITGVRKPDPTKTIPDPNMIFGADMIQDLMSVRGKMIVIPDELRNLDIFDLDAIGIDPVSGMPIPILKSFNERMKKPKYNVVIISPLGFQKQGEFYSPRYDTPEARSNATPDLRSTIYWKPNVLADSTGKATLDFYTADDPTTYSAVIEGVTDDGKLIYRRVESFIKAE